MFWPKYFLDVKQFFSSLCFCDKLLRLSSPGWSCLILLAPNLFQRLPSVLLTFWLHHNFWNWFFLRKLTEKNGILMRISLLNVLIGNFWDTAALGPHLPNFGCFLLTFKMTKFSFPARFCAKLESVPSTSAVHSFVCSLPNFSWFCYMFSGIA